MSTSGTYDFILTAADIIDEAYERCGKDPAELTYRHLNSAVRSLNLLFTGWINKGFHQWAIVQYTQTLTRADYEYDMPTGAVDIVSMVLRRGGIDTPMLRISREDYLALSDKDIEGMPDRYFVDREITTPNIILWNAPENSTDQIIYYYLRRLQDVGAISNNPDVPYRWYEAICAGLSEKLAVKFASDKLAVLKTLAIEAFEDAWSEDRDRSSTIISVDYERSNRT